MTFVAETVTPLSILETLKGRLLYAAGHTFGRCMQLAIQLMWRLARRGPMVLLDERFKGIIRDALRCLAEAPAREVGAWSGRVPIVVFIDETTFFGLETGSCLMFGDNIPEAWLQRWRRDGKTQLICQAEIFPILVADATWSDLLSRRAMFWFVDNNSALSAVIRAFSPVIKKYKLLVWNSRLDVKLQSMSSYARVPSKSNLSDEASRLKFENLQTQGCDANPSTISSR